MSLNNTELKLKLRQTHIHLIHLPNCWGYVVQISMTFFTMLCLGMTKQIVQDDLKTIWLIPNLLTLPRKATIHQVTTMLATSKNVLFPVITACYPPILMTLHSDYHPRWCSGDNQSVRSSVKVVSTWLWSENRTFWEVASMVVTWWIVAFLGNVSQFMYTSGEK